MTTEHFDLYEDSTIEWAVRLVDDSTPVDLTGATVTADIDDPAGVRLTGWTATIRTQTGDDTGWIDLALDTAAKTALLNSGLVQAVYDVRVVTATGDISYPVERSKITIARAVTA